MSIDLGRRLIAAGVVPPEEVEAALFLSCVRGVPFARVLLDRGAISARSLEDELERVGGLGLRQVAGSAELVAKLPRAMCRRLAALPVRVDNVTGTVDVVAADPLDGHIPAEFGFHLGAPIRVLRAPIAAIEEAIRRLELDDQSPGPGRARRVTPPFPHGAPQSTMPPPVVDEAPIPLVRRLAIVPPAAADIEPSRAAIAPDAPGESPSDEAPAPRQARIDRVGRAASGSEPPAVSFPSQPPASGPDLALDPGPDADQEPAAPFTRTMRPEAPALLVTPAATRPAKRNPDEPTPPYGTPILAPPSAAFDPASELHERATMQRTVRPPLLADLAQPRYPAFGPVPKLDVVDEADIEGSTVDDVDVVVAVADEPKPVRAPDGRAVLEALRRVTNRDEVVRLALRGLHLIAPRFGVFAVKRDGFHGWACNVELGDQDDFRKVKIALDQPSVLATAAATSLYLGPIPSTPAHAPLLVLMGRASFDVAAIAVRVGGRPALVLLADDLEDTLLGTRFLDELSRAIGDALARLLVTRG
ncbi:MAG: hypothetical protein ABJE95_04590 [Byssovorax sp.]